MNMAPKTLILRRLTAHFSNRIRQNQRLLSSHVYSSSALEEAPSSSSSSSSSPDLDGVHMTDTCIQKMKQLQASEAQEKMLRLSVETGGCSGFQYVFDLVDDKTNPDDRVFEKQGVKLVVDSISYDFLKGATVDYVEELIRSAFQLDIAYKALYTEYSKNLGNGKTSSNQKHPYRNTEAPYET